MKARSRLLVFGSAALIVAGLSIILLPRPRASARAVQGPPPCISPTCFYLDIFQDRFMHRLVYRNFGTHESLVLNHSVNVSGMRPTTPATHQAGVRYYALRRASGGPFKVQEQATFAPDKDNRWMGSAAMDGGGNIAIGYSVSSTTTFPSIRYAARLAGAPPNGLFQGEATIIAGSGSQRSSHGRWGDYSAMSIDPADDATFWYTQEYYTREGSDAFSIGWQTRIAAFRLPGVVPATLGTLRGLVTDCASSQPVAGVLVEISGSRSRATLANGAYEAQLPPGTYTVRAQAPGRPVSDEQRVTVTAGGTVTADFCLNAVSVIVTGRTGFNGESCVPTDSVISPGERLSIVLTLPNNGAAPTRNLVAELLPRGGVVAPSEPQSYGAIAPGKSASRTFSFTVGAQCGDDLHCHDRSCPAGRLSRLDHASRRGDGNEPKFAHHARLSNHRRARTGNAAARRQRARAGKPQTPAAAHWPLALSALNRSRQILRGRP